MQTAAHHEKTKNKTKWNNHPLVSSRSSLSFSLRGQLGLRTRSAGRLGLGANGISFMGVLSSVSSDAACWSQSRRPTGVSGVSESASCSSGVLSSISNEDCSCSLSSTGKRGERQDGWEEKTMDEWMTGIPKTIKKQKKKKNVRTLYRDLTQTSEPGSDEALPGKSTVRASWTACLSRLSRANIQWGFTCCCFNTFFTCAQSRKFNVSVRKSCVSLNLLTRGMSVLTLKWSNLLHLGSWTAPPAGCSVTLRRREVRLGAPAGYWSAASCPASGCFLSSS